MTVANLRGLRESGNIFAIPTYAFVFLALLMVGIGLYPHRDRPGPSDRHAERRRRSTGGELSIFLLLKAFAGGSVALTGVEAIANGVPAFKPPEAKNAANTMTAMAILLGGPVHRDHDHLARLRRSCRRSATSRRPCRSSRRASFGQGHRPVRPVPGLDRPDPVPRREHVVQRVPAARSDPRGRRLHAAPVRVSRRPPRLLLGDRPPRGGRGLPHLALQGQRDRADPALLGRRVRLLHPQPDRDGPPLAEGPRRRLGLAGRR